MSQQVIKSICLIERPEKAFQAASPYIRFTTWQSTSRRSQPAQTTQTESLRQPGDDDDSSLLHYSLLHDVQHKRFRVS